MSLPCKPLCRLNLHRFHLRCFTCLNRRYYYNKFDRQDYVFMPVNTRFWLANVDIPLKMPKGYRLYYLIVNFNGNNSVKRYIKLFTVAMLKRFRWKLGMLKPPALRTRVFADAHMPTIMPHNYATVMFVTEETLRVETGLDIVKRRFHKFIRSVSEVIANW